MKKLIYLLVSLVMVGLTAAPAQVILPQKDQEASLRRDVFGLGLFGGSVGGLGISFRHHLPSRLSYQLTGGIIKVDKRLLYDIGGQADFDLARNERTRLYAALGGGYYYSGESDGNNMNAPGRFGVGVGGEMAVGSGFHGSLELMFTYFTDGTVLPLPQVGIYYYFY